MTAIDQHHRDFVIERIYPSCTAHVWATWSIREKKAAWMRSPGLEMDFRPGGFERNRSRSDRGEHVNETRYFEIKEGNTGEYGEYGDTCIFLLLILRWQARGEICSCHQYQHQYPR